LLAALMVTVARDHSSPRGDHLHRQLFLVLPFPWASPDSVLGEKRHLELSSEAVRLRLTASSLSGEAVLLQQYGIPYADFFGWPPMVEG